LLKSFPRLCFLFWLARHKRTTQQCLLARSVSPPMFLCTHHSNTNTNTHRVPLGFVCGYPLNGGELYGGSMFARSAAPDTAQGRAIQSVNERWGDSNTACARKKGRESIGIPVCKKKYKPFHFSVLQTQKDGTVRVVVERLYGCQCHHPQRKRVIERHGVRDGWQPFGVWSMAKAQAQARRETARLNAAAAAKNNSNNSDAETASTTDDESSSTSSSASDSENAALTAVASNNKTHRMCLNGNCTWKVQSAYDNIYKEIHGESENDE